MMPDLAPAARLPIVALVASAGGLDALSEVLAALPAGLGAAVVVLQHLEPGRESMLAGILRRRTKLAVEEAREGSRLRAGTVFVAPASHHLRVLPDQTLQLADTAPVHYSRPSADVLLASLAASGNPVVAAVLTGRGCDGAEGSLLVRQSGGTVLAQDEATSRHYDMPGAALRGGGAAESLPLGAIAARLTALVDTLCALAK
jgi:two-component system, chemotaxis family, protein-glutamate methylesterase/glutaminase